MEDTIYLKMRSYAIQLLKFEKSMVKIRNKEATFQHYSKQLIIHWTLKRLNNSKHKDMWEDLNCTNDDVLYKAEQLDSWILKEYKNKIFMRAYDNEYYHTRRKFSEKFQEKRKSIFPGFRGILGEQLKKEALIIKNKKSAKTKTDRNLLKVKQALGACQYAKIKPTIAKLMEITGLGKMSVIKYKKILMPKKPKV